MNEGNTTHIRDVSRGNLYLCICEKKSAGQMHENGASDQRLCFPFIESAVQSLYFSSLKPVIVAIQISKTGFLMTRLILLTVHNRLSMEPRHDKNCLTDSWKLTTEHKAIIFVVFYHLKCIKTK